MVNVKIVGALGYGGVGMIELLCRHPEAQVAELVDVEGAGSPVSDIWPPPVKYSVITSSVVPSAWIRPESMSIVRPQMERTADML